MGNIWSSENGEIYKQKRSAIYTDGSVLSDDRLDLFEAANSGDVDSLLFIALEHKDKSYYKRQSNERASPLVVAAMSNNIKAVQILLPLSDPKEPNVREWTALMAAVFNNNKQMVELLLPVSNRDYDGSGVTALDIAKSKGFADIVAILSAE